MEVSIPVRLFIDTVILNVVGVSLPAKPEAAARSQRERDSGGASLQDGEKLMESE